jgi:UDP-glucose 4-epimerase
MDNIADLKTRPGFSYVIDTVMNDQLMAELIDRADVIFHLAAAVGVRLIVEAPVRTIETNVHGTEVVLKHAAKKNKLVVIFSTSEVYGKSGDVPFREDSDLVMGATNKHRWAYACSKAIDEFLALAYHREKKLPVIVVRLFNTVGPRQTGRYGMVIPTFMRQALAGEPITVYGDGKQTRSFTDVRDVVSGLTRLMNEPRAVGEVFNIGNNEEVSIHSLAERIKALTASSFADRADPLRRGLRRRLRGHAAARPGPAQDRGPGRLPADAVAGSDSGASPDAHTRRSRAGQSGIIDQRVFDPTSAEGR